MLLSSGRITGDVINVLMSWCHSGFNLYTVGHGSFKPRPWCIQKMTLVIFMDKEIPALPHLRVPRKGIKGSLAARNVERVVRNGKPYSGDPSD